LYPRSFYQHDPYPWSDNFNLEGTLAKENYSAGIDDGGGASWSGHSDKIKVGSCIFW
jgi:hypothetical protein